MDQDFTVSVLIVNWNARADLADCLRSVRAQREQPFEVVVVDNGSSDGSAEMVRKHFPEVKLLEPGENLGFAEGNNVGLQVCRGSWVALLNNDAVADPRWLSELCAAAQAGGPRLGSLQSRVLFRQKPTHTNSTGILVYTNGRARDRDFDAPARADDRYGEIFGPTAAAALYRRAMLDEVRLPSGWFDRGFFMYLEDVDLSWRCRLAGWESFYVPSSIVHHAFHGSSARRGNDFVEMQCRKNRLRTLIKNASPGFLLSSLGTSLSDVAIVSWRSRLRQTPELIWGIVDATLQRRAQNGTVKLERRKLERRWMKPDPG
jgi:GT2 family glycosyltransferase